MVHEKAIKSSRGLSGDVVELLHDCLEELAACSAARRAARDKGEPLPGLREWFKKVPSIDYSPRESVSTLGQYGKDREVLYEGQTICCGQHLKFGGKQALRVYFEELEDGRFIVGRAGRHAPTATVPT